MTTRLPTIILEEEEDDYDSSLAPSPSPRAPMVRVDSQHRSHSPSVLSQSSRHFSQPRIDDDCMGKMMQLGILSEKQSRFGTTYKYLHRQSMAEYAVTKWESNLNEETLSEICTALDNLQALSHPRIGNFYAYNLSGSTFTMFRLFVPSGTVGDILKRGPLPEATSLKYFRQGVEGLQYLHERKWVHGNIKTVNLLLTLSDDIMLTDLWIPHSPMTTDLHRRRRLLYAAPELMRDKESLYKTSAAADIWAMGCVLVTMVTRFPPFKDHFLRQSTEEVHTELLKFHSGPSPYRSETLIPSASRSLSEIVDLALEPSPAQRPKARQLLEKIADPRSYSASSTAASSLQSVSPAPRKMNHDDLYYSDAPVTPLQLEEKSSLTEAPSSEADSASPIYCFKWYSSRLVMFFLLLVKWIGMVLLAACSLAMVAGSVFFAIFVIYNGIGVVCQCQLNEGFIVLIALILLPIIILLTTLCCNNTCEKYKVAKEDGSMEHCKYVSAHPEDDVILCGVVVVQGKREQRKQSVRRKNAGNEENDPTAASNLPKTAFVRGVASIA